MKQPHPEPAADAIAAVAELIAAVAGASVQLAVSVADHVDRLVADVLLDAREVAEQSEALSRVVAERAAVLARDVRRYASDGFAR